MSEVLDISVTLHFTVDPTDWEDCKDQEIAEDVAMHVSSLVFIELGGKYKNSEVSFCERRSST